MWGLYKRTFAGMQVVMVLAAVCGFLFVDRSWIRVGFFFAVMQVSAVVGAVWAARLSAALQRKKSALPLRPSA